MILCSQSTANNIHVLKSSSQVPEIFVWFLTKPEVPRQIFRKSPEYKISRKSIQGQQRWCMRTAWRTRQSLALFATIRTRLKKERWYWRLPLKQARPSRRRRLATPVVHTQQGLMWLRGWTHDLTQSGVDGPGWGWGWGGERRICHVNYNTSLHVIVAGAWQRIVGANFKIGFLHLFQISTFYTQLTYVVPPTVKDRSYYSCDSETGAGHILNFMHKYATKTYFATNIRSVYKENKLSSINLTLAGPCIIILFK